MLVKDLQIGDSLVLYNDERCKVVDKHQLGNDVTLTLEYTLFNDKPRMTLTLPGDKSIDNL